MPLRIPDLPLDYIPPRRFPPNLMHLAHQLAQPAIDDDGLYQQFSDEVLDARPSVNGVGIDSLSVSCREDAYWITSSDKGKVVTTSITDADEVIQYGTPLDEEALKRGNATYSGGRRVAPMFPEPIYRILHLTQEDYHPTVSMAIHLDTAGRIIATRPFLAKIEIAPLLSEEIPDIKRDSQDPYQNQILQGLIIARQCKERRQAQKATPKASGKQDNNKENAEFIVNEIMELTKRAVMKFLNENGVHLPWEDEQKGVPFTSPLRDYSALVAHRMVKALIREEPLPYSNDELDAIDKHLKARKRAVKRVQFKRRPEEDFLKGDFNKIRAQLEFAYRENLLTPSLLGALETRLEEGTLNAHAIFSLIRAIETHGSPWTQIKARVKNYILQRPRLAMSLLNVAQQKHPDWTKYEICRRWNGSYVAATIEGFTLTSKKAAVTSLELHDKEDEVESRHAAALLFWRDYFEKQLNSKGQPRIAEYVFVNPRELTDKPFSAAEELKKICQKNGWQFKFERERERAVLITDDKKEYEILLDHPHQTENLIAAKILHWLAIDSNLILGEDEYVNTLQHCLNGNSTLKLKIVRERGKYKGTGIVRTDVKKTAASGELSDSRSHARQSAARALLQKLGPRYTQYAFYEDPA